MKGSYHIIVQNNRIKFEFDIKRNITIIRGDSATGKTTLMGLIETYDRLGDESGIMISCARKCKALSNNNWESVIDQSDESIIFIDEETKVIKTVEFAEKIKNSNNYYVIITRENLPNLPYSVQEIYGIHTTGKYADVRQTYNSFYRLYSLDGRSGDKIAELVVVEDSNSGFDFFDSVVSENVKCFSASGKTKIKGVIHGNRERRILVIADGAAFGSEIGELYLYMQHNPQISLYLPESFEWIILASGLIDGNRIADIVENTENYVDSAEFFSWEQFYTKLLVDETQNTYLKYNKSNLNKVYLNPKEKEDLIKVIDVIKPLLGIDIE